MKEAEDQAIKIPETDGASKAKHATEKTDKKMRIESNQKAESGIGPDALLRLPLKERVPVVKRECGNAQPGNGQGHGPTVHRGIIPCGSPRNISMGNRHLRARPVFPSPQIHPALVTGFFLLLFDSTLSLHLVWGVQRQSHHQTCATSFFKKKETTKKLHVLNAKGKHLEMPQRLSIIRRKSET